MTVTRVDERGRAEAEVEFVDPAGVQVVTAELTGRVPCTAGEREALEAMLAAGDPTNALAGWAGEPRELTPPAPRGE